MSDSLEKFIRENRSQMDAEQPREKSWEDIRQQLDEKSTRNVRKWIRPATFAAAAAVVIVIITVIWMYQENKIAHPQQTAQENNNMKEDQPPVHPASVIQPPLKSARIPYLAFEVPAHQAYVLDIKDHAKIVIPENAFVFADGSPVTEPVTIRYRDFHNAAEILVSGIPMTIEHQGKTETFQTAGMFELRGESGGKEVRIAPGKELKVEFVTHTGEDDHRLYYLDTTNGKWEDLGIAEIEQPGYQAVETPAPQVAQPRKADDIPAEDIFIIAVDEVSFPEFKAYKNVQWTALHKKDRQAIQEAQKKIWSDVQLAVVDSLQMHYSVVFTKGSRKAEFLITPVFSGADYDAEMQRFRRRKMEYQKLLAEKTETEERIANQKRNENQRLEKQQQVWMRVISTAKFGVYNCDRYYKMSPESIVQVAVTFDFGEPIYLDPNETTIFHLTGKNRAVIGWKLSEIQQFRFDKNENNSLVIVLPDDKIAVGTLYEFEKAETTPGGKVTFRMNVISAKVESAEDLMRYAVL